ncbi:MAG: endolytic transglycosylase MltG [Pseudomonadota bacterium]|jgi:UPF0755 protein
MFRKLLLALISLCIAVAAMGVWWVNSSVAFEGETLDVELDPGIPARAVAQTVVSAGAKVNAGLLYALFRVSGKSRQIKAGSYEFDKGVTPWQMLSDFTAGKEALRRITLVEGWTFSQVRAALNAHEHIRHDSRDMDGATLMSQLGKPGVHPEGRFFPDTYTFGKNASDLKVLARAMKAMDQRLAKAWAQRSADSPLQTPEQALVLASIVEKETGSAADRGKVAGVFNNRLRIGMLLQTDPTVIYGMGERYQGRIRKIDLQTDTPYNTYTRAGLPPTPISMPGAASLLAAVQPEATKAIYFVARGDGSSQFSQTLDEHNRAVAKYILKRQ